MPCHYIIAVWIVFKRRSFPAELQAIATASCLTNQQPQQWRKKALSGVTLHANNAILFQTKWRHNNAIYDSTSLHEAPGDCCRKQPFSSRRLGLALVAPTNSIQPSPLKCSIL